MSVGGRWVARGVPAKSGAEPSMRLFCFAHAGGGAGLYHPWRALLAPEIDVCPIVLPGRESRRTEPLARRVHEVLEPIYDALLPLADRPYALFGHSMGTILALETARRFCSRHWRPPLRLVVSGRRAPHLPSRRNPYWQLPDDAFLRAVSGLNGTPEEISANPALLSLFLPPLRADFELTETYAPGPIERLSCPITVFRGLADPEIDGDEAEAWREWTDRDSAVHEFEGDHFYLGGGRPDVAAAISRLLAGDLPSRRRMPTYSGSSGNAHPSTV